LLLLLHLQLPIECCGHLGDLLLSALDVHHQEARLKVLIHSVGLSLQVSHQFVFVNPVLGCLPLLPTWSNESSENKLHQNCNIKVSKLYTIHIVLLHIKHMQKKKRVDFGNATVVKFKRKTILDKCFL
jgi:hypothetical protein